MAPSRKSRSVNRRQSNVDDSPAGKNLDSPTKKGSRKRKLSTLLGPQWTKEELERFYKSYRKNGQDWEKVSASVRTRSAEMVEALYTMNRAYLSLPKGYASAAGLIAMMTDHYANMGGSDSEQDVNDGAEISRRPQKRARGTKYPEGNLLPDISASHPDSSDEGCLSLLKKRRYVSKPWAVGKRTPRVPVSFSNCKENGEHFFSTMRRATRVKNNVLDDDVAHEIALALAEASKRAGSPQVSRTPNKKCNSYSPVKNEEQTQAESEMTSAKVRGNDVEENGYELSFGGSTDVNVGGYPRDKDPIKNKKYKMKPEMDETMDNHLDDVKEACSGTEEDRKLGTGKEKLNMDDFSPKLPRISNKVSRKKSKKLFFGEDEDTAFQALQALADLSSMLPETPADTASSVDVNDDRIAYMTKSKIKGNHSAVGSSKVTKQERKSPNNSPNIQKKNGLQSRSHGIRKRRQKPLETKSMEAAVSISSQLEESKKTVNEVTLSEVQETNNDNDTNVELGKLIKPPACAPEPDIRDAINAATSTVRVLSADEFNLPTKVRSRRKISMPRLSVGNDVKVFATVATDSSDVMFEDKSSVHKNILSNCLSRYQVRRWCTYEWFYSALDYPWFAKREFVEYLDHVGLGHIPKLTHVEWGVIRSSLGKPRRFSQQFLVEEKEKLNQYRESVRKHYSDLRSGKQDCLPTDLGRPLSVGQRVIALHPRTREIHDGSVLTVDHNRCRIQFDQPELGVEFVMDIDCMPLSQLENMPVSVARHSIPFMTSLNSGTKSHGSPIMKNHGIPLAIPSDTAEYSLPHPSMASNFADTLFQQAKGVLVALSPPAKYTVGENVSIDPVMESQPSIDGHAPAKEADILAISELTRALDKKEAVVSELQRMNDAVVESQKQEGNPLKDLEPFKKHYATVILQLSEVNEQVSSALMCLRQRNTYQANTTPMWLKTVNPMDETVSLRGFYDMAIDGALETTSHVVEIVESSRSKAQSMVAAALQAIPLSDANETVQNIEDAIDFVNHRLSADDLSIPAPRSPPATSAQGVSISQDQSSTTIEDVGTSNNDQSSTTVNGVAKAQGSAKFPSQLIAECVATLLMIQRCTERQFPPSDVAKVLDSAVTNLKPCCPQNFPIYAEIQKCMGIIRNQILALVPT